MVKLCRGHTQRPAPAMAAVATPTTNYHEHLHSNGEKRKAIDRHDLDGPLAKSAQYL